MPSVIVRGDGLGNPVKRGSLRYSARVTGGGSPKRSRVLRQHSREHREMTIKPGDYRLAFHKKAEEPHSFPTDDDSSNR
jgi:hypothetical protein